MLTPGKDVRDFINNNRHTTVEKGAVISTLHNAELTKIQRTSNPAPVVAIYSFPDLTGQRKSNSTFALFSTAVTMDPASLLLRAVKHAGEGKFFKVVERAGLDHLTKERQLIRSTRNSLDEKEPVLPLLFAGLIFTGGVIGYDTNLKTGGIGARYLGIGAQKQYREDTVSISIRVVSVSSGEVLMETLVTKTILSVGVSQDVFRFIELGTELVEVENGVTKNESVTIALQKALETGVLEIIYEGEKRGYWETVLIGEENEISGS
jgi:curli production assembly/transport component CsgG|tara:strand:- start:228 stop:1019 length:792 start_codon:yes stop_codon:yes gene_type:complete